MRLPAPSCLTALLAALALGLAGCDGGQPGDAAVDGGELEDSGPDAAADADADAEGDAEAEVDADPDAEGDADLETPTDADLDTPTDAEVPPTGPEVLPSPTGTCPELVDGTVTFSPAGIAPRDVRLWLSETEAALRDGPLIFYWHGTGGRPSSATYALGAATIAAVTSMGGIVAAPFHDLAAGTYPWYLTTGTREDDLLVADEVVACAIEQLGIDTRHLHSIGMSAGALHTTQMSYRRSGYLASVVTYSGGLLAAAPAPAEPDNLFAALVFHGGPTDVVVISFQEASERYWRALTGAGHFAAICDHGGGHTIPTAATPSVWQFFQDHPFGRAPSPYAAGLPAGFPTYCGLEP